MAAESRCGWLDSQKVALSKHFKAAFITLPVIYFILNMRSCVLHAAGVYHVLRLQK